MENYVYEEIQQLQMHGSYIETLSCKSGIHMLSAPQFFLINACDVTDGSCVWSSIGFGTSSKYIVTEHINGHHFIVPVYLSHIRNCADVHTQCRF